MSTLYRGLRSSQFAANRGGNRSGTDPVPNTALALVTELFRDWKSPVADKGRELIKWYLAEVQKIAASA
jgi:hypothetical protein